MDDLVLLDTLTPGGSLPRAAAANGLNVPVGDGT